MKVYFLLAGIIFFVASCSKDNGCGCFDSNGEVASEYRALSPFHELEIDNVFDVTLHIDSIPRISIETGRHLFKGIETKIENNRLYIKNKNRCNWARKYIGHIKLDIYTDELNYIRLNGSCNVRGTDTIFTNEIRVDDYTDISTVDMCVKCSTMTFALHAGTGDITLHGSANISYFWSMGYGYFHFTDFPTDLCYIMSNSTGNCYVMVNKEIEATLKNSGNIYFSGNAYKFTSTQTGSGKLIRN
jgi:hypothetical protein